MKFITPRACQGQIVEYSYALTETGVYQRVSDSSDRSTKYFFASYARFPALDAWAESQDGTTPPDEVEWQPAKAPSAK